MSASAPTRTGRARAAWLSGCVAVLTLAACGVQDQVETKSELEGQIRLQEAKIALDVHCQGQDPLRANECSRYTSWLVSQHPDTLRACVAATGLSSPGRAWSCLADRGVGFEAYHTGG